ncbi:MAG: GxxExxY protein [Phycisphaerales bacterium]|nr:GxxExxY protein [Phycisphaerales bacterium]
MQGLEAQRDPLTEAVIGAAIEVHKALGPGLLESAYVLCLCHELTQRGLSVTREVPIPISYKGVGLDAGYRIDVLVNDELVVEVKAVLEHHPLFQAQLLTYLRLSGKRKGLLINFNVPVVKDGIRRFVL